MPWIWPDALTINKPVNDGVDTQDAENDQELNHVIYDYLCRKCGSETEAVNSIAERRTNAPICCDERMDIIIKTAPLGFVQRECRYVCPVTNKPVTTWRDRRNIMAEKNLIDANDLVNKKTIQQSVDRAAKIKEIAEAHRAPEHLSREVKKQVEKVVYG